MISKLFPRNNCDFSIPSQTESFLSNSKPGASQQIIAFRLIADRSLLNLSDFSSPSSRKAQILTDADMVRAFVLPTTFSSFIGFRGFLRQLVGIGLQQMALESSHNEMDFWDEIARLTSTVRRSLVCQDHTSLPKQRVWSMTCLEI